MKFTVLGPASASIRSARLGVLAVPGRKTVATPHFLVVTSRGTVPHVAHDVMRDQTAIGSVYIALEDFIEKSSKDGGDEPPVYKTPTAPDESALRKFIGMPADMLLVLGPRRVPPIHCPTANTATSISVLTSVGFRQLEAGQYVEAVRRLHPDIVVGLADVVLGREPGVKRRSKMVDRTHAYTTHATEALYGSSRAAAAATSTAYFAPIPPLDNQLEMRFYWEELEGELRPRTGGLAFYAAASLATVPESLADQPRLLLTEPMSPQEILRSIALGADLMALPLLSACTDAGMALSFSFPAPRPDSDGDKPLPLPLACDMWAPVHATDESPLVAGCECHTCKTHHRAYIRHLLTAREMLAWTLLQIHNHHVLDMFFAAVRDSIGRGTFEQDICGFEAAYESGLPETTGQGPRLRGYQLPASGPSQPKRAPKVFGRLDDAADKYAESVSSGATPDAGAESIEARGFAAKQLDSD